MLKKIISGGQTGIDQAGLLAAVYLGIPTGGWAPYNWMTETGEAKDALEKLGLKPDRFDPKIYPIRTESNIQEADGTVIFSCGMKSPGTTLTINLCKRNKRPYFIIDNVKDVTKLQEFVDWLVNHQIQTLNVAGPRESKIGRLMKEEVINFLIKSFKHIQSNKITY